MTLPPPPSSAVSLDGDEPTFADAEEELAWMLDCIAIETRIRTAMKLQKLGETQRVCPACSAQGFEGNLVDEESGIVEIGPASAVWSSDGWAAGEGETTRPWGRYLPPSSC